MTSPNSTASDRAASSPDGRLVPLSDDGKSVFIDGFGEVPLAYPASSPEAADERAAQPDMAKIEQDAVSNAMLRCLGKITQAYRYFRAQGKTEEEFDRCAREAMGEAVRYAVSLTAREVRDPVWPYAAAPRAALASAPAGAGEGASLPVSPELDATMLWLGETRDSLRAMADRANQLLTAHCRAALAGEPAVAADEGREP